MKREAMGACASCQHADCEQWDGRATCADYQRPRVIVLSGSTRYRIAFREWAARLVVEEGAIVLPPTVWSHNPAVRSDELLCSRLFEIHLAKIEMCDELFVLNVGGGIGESTAREIAYAESRGKRIRFLDVECPYWGIFDVKYRAMWDDPATASEVSP